MTLADGSRFTRAVRRDRHLIFFGYVQTYIDSTNPSGAGRQRRLIGSSELLLKPSNNLALVQVVRDV
jgi:hypothetical protein